MLKNFLTDQLALAIAIGREPNPLGGAQRLANSSELGGLVAALCRASAVETVGPEQYWRPSLPLRYNILRFQEVEQMAFSRQDMSLTRANCGADVFCLAGFLSDDDLICHASSSGRNRFGDGSPRT
jgi:hypothetical protein